MRSRKPVHVPPRQRAKPIGTIIDTVYRRLDPQALQISSCKDCGTTGHIVAQALCDRHWLICKGCRTASEETASLTDAIKLWNMLQLIRSNK